MRFHSLNNRLEKVKAKTSAARPPTTGIHRRHRYTPALPEHLTPALFHSTLADSQNALLSSSSSTLPDVLDPDDLVENVRVVTTLLKEDSTDVMICKSLHDLWGSCQDIVRGSADLMFRHRIHRIQLLLTAWFTWRWLYVECAEHIQRFLKPSTDMSVTSGPLLWLFDLTQAVDTHFVQRSPEVLELNPYHFLPGSMEDLDYFEIHSAAKTMPENQLIVNTILECLSFWIGLPESSFYVRGAILDAILTAANSTGILALDPIWIAYTEPWSYAFGDPKNRLGTPENLKCFKNGLTDVVNGSVEQDLDDLSVIVAETLPHFMEHATDLLNRSSSIVITPSATPFPAHSTSSSSNSSSSTSTSRSSSVYLPASSTPPPLPAEITYVP
ncbi:hypothetical protein BD410DRAFT_847203 [Rickenella mellea]|uniref:Uncharacterized protein n=1 Tax=Rickenella mellea TaxID=50990 RepID=A0A4Y7PD81_9AGAM|nr:hypothetical protein BD410DRAFT_847203 [Rickenella mellea]